MEGESIEVTITGDISRYHVDPLRIKGVAATVLAHLGKPSLELSIQFTDIKNMARLNEQFRQKKSSTDVLSFAQMEFESPLMVGECAGCEALDGPPTVLGDVVVSLDDARANAVSIGHGLDCEVSFLIVHGILHLCGHDHMQEEEEKLMIGEQKKLMGLLSDKEGRPLWADCVVERP